MVALVACLPAVWAFLGILRKQDGPASGLASAAPEVPVGAEVGEDPTTAEFRCPERQDLLAELERRWAEASKALREGAYPEIERDPFFTIDAQGLLRRYLLAARFDIDEAVLRLRSTAQWRREWDVLAYYEPGAAMAAFAEDPNPGAEMYFADSLGTDAKGRPYLAGRLRFANSENMHPWRHLRAGVLVFELLATRVAALGRGPASYILDIGAVGGVAGTVSGTGGLDREYDEGKNPYYVAGAGTEDAPSPRMVEELGSLDNGFAVLKAAIRILNRHYPGVIGQVCYLNSDMLFWGAFKIFSRWIADRGSIDFQFLWPAGWREEPMSRLLETYPAKQLFREWGGRGPSLDGDGFLRRAVEYYEAEAAARKAAAQAAAPFPRRAVAAG